MIDAKGFEKLDLLKTAANAVSGLLEEKKTFQTYASELIRLVKYANRSKSILLISNWRDGMIPSAARSIWTYSLMMRLISTIKSTLSAVRRF